MNKNLKIVIACVFFLAAAALILVQLGVFEGPPQGAPAPTQGQVDLEPARDGSVVRDGVLETGQGVRRYGSEPSLIPD